MVTDKKKTNNWIMEKQIMDMFFFYNDENLCLFTMVNIGDDQLSLCHVIIFLPVITICNAKEA